MGRPNNPAGVIYHAFDETNGMAYVGQTWNFERRKEEHLYVGPGLFVDRAIRKRPERFVWSILCVGLTSQQEMDDAETAFIRELGTLHPGGYNLREGGSTGRASELSKQRMSEAQVKANARPEVMERKKRAWKKTRSAPSWREGQRRTQLEACKRPEVIERKKRAALETWLRPEVRAKRVLALSLSVICENDPEFGGPREWASARAASRYYGIGGVNEICHGKRPQHKSGLIFRWKEKTGGEPQ